MVITGKTSTGFPFAVDERAKKDWRFIKAYKTIRDVESSDYDKVNAMFDMLSVLFKDGGDALAKHVAEFNDGYQDAEKMMLLLGEVLSADSELKK